MITQKIRSLLLSVCAFALCGGNFLTAQQANEGIIALTPEEEIAMYTDRLAMMPDAIIQNPSLAYSINSPAEEAIHLKRIHPYAYSFLVAATASGDNIQLADASVWYVHPNNRNIVKTWISTDPLFIKPIATCWSFYSYVIQNRETNDIIEVSLLNPPLDNGAATHWITYINPIDRIVYLNDNSMWKINPKDKSFNKWMIGHRLIVGVNNKWRESKYPHILINTGIYKAPYAEAYYTQ